MDLQGFNLDLRPNTTNKTKFQVVLVHATAKNSYFILGDFSTERIPGKRAVKVKKVDFIMKHIDNDIKYVNIKNVEFIEKDNRGLPGIKFCLDVTNKPNYDITTLEFETPIELKTGGAGKLRFHIDFSDDCGGHPTWVGGWPCLTNSVM